MRKNSNYNSDFIEMQRTSFCWFIAEGLSQQLSMFSHISDFSKNTEYLLFGNEYFLLKPRYNILTSKKLKTNYTIQLAIPLEIRHKNLNNVRYRSIFPLINLPLMTSSASFIIGGCERVIVSQIIRSPGVYFEKHKNQKKRKNIKRKLPASLNSLKDFAPLGEIVRSQKSITIYSLFNYQNSFKNKVKVYPKFDYTHKFKNFLKLLKVYFIILKTSNGNKKSERIKLFFEWFSLNHIPNEIYFISEIKVCMRLLIKYELITKIIKNDFDKIEAHWVSKINQSTIDSKNIKILTHYLKTLEEIFSNKLLIGSLKQQNGFKQMNQFKFLKETNFYIKKIEETNYFKEKSLKSTIYFPSTLKEYSKFKFKKSSRNLKSSEIIKYRELYETKTSYDKKYNEKEFYTAILVPEYGSWVRFEFQKNIKLTQYDYPIKNQEDTVVIQLDKFNQKSIIQFLKEMGLTDLEICHRLEHASFFYFNKPLLIGSFYSETPVLHFNLKSDYEKNISEFSRIFDAQYYHLGKVGRFKVNNRLNLQINNNLQTVTYDDIFAIIDHLITLSISKTVGDDIDHLKNRRVRSVGQLLQYLFKIGFKRLIRKLSNKVNKNQEEDTFSRFYILESTIKEFFGSSQLSQYMDQTNPLSALTHRRRISGLGPGGFNRDHVSFKVRDIHPSHYGRICPIETPEGQNVGLIASLTTCARVNKSGFIETPFWRVLNGKVIKTISPIYLTADIEDFYKIAPADISINKDNYLTKALVPVRYQQDFLTVAPYEVDFISISPVQVVSVAASLIPFFEHDDANRALMGSNMQRQSVPLIFPQKPIVGTGLENKIATDSGMSINARKSGIVDYVSGREIVIKDYFGKKSHYILQKYERSNQETCINHRPIVWKGEMIKSGQILTDGPGIDSSELALGQNVLLAYMPWKGYNFEDAILINERLVYENIFTSIHIEHYEVEIDKTSESYEKTTKNIPNLNISETQYLTEDGIISVGTFVRPGDILVGKIVENDDLDQSPESRFLQAIFGSKAKSARDTSFRMPMGEYGRVIETLTFNEETKLTYKFQKIQIIIAQFRKIKVGDKIAGRHGNKGIISRILPRQDMPFLPDGTSIDIILNPLGVPSRMNVGQLYECLLGFVGHKLNHRFKILPFDEMYGKEASRILINKKLRQASVEKNEAWLFNPYCPGKVILVDGRTGKEFENPITVGNGYMLKLIHLVDDKMHARATGPYSLITQQPLGGKAQHGGQRFGEMEVWALEAFGAAFTLKELLTIKSDDIEGRNETLSAIVRGKSIPTSEIPESFNVLLQELRAIGLDISTYKIERFNNTKTYESEVDLIEKYDPLKKTYPSI